MKSPLVSIIIPVFNGQNYLREAINSALDQTYEHIEVIVINDGSTDSGATEKIARSYGRDIRYFEKKNGGVATALNLGISQMKGEYFSWLSHDDLYYPEKVEKQINALYEKGENYRTIVLSEFDLLEENTNQISKISQTSIYSEDKLTNSVFPVLQGLVHGCALLIHKSHFERVGLFNEKLVTTQDYDLWFRMLRNQKTIFLSEALILSRVHDTQGSRTLPNHDLEREQLHIKFMKELTEREMTDMYGSSYMFYHRMVCFFRGGKMNKSYQYANKKLQEVAINDAFPDKRSELQKFISDISQGRATRVCIFCAGDYGIRLYEELRAKLISVDCFSDNNAEKWGYLFDNIYCIEPKLLEGDKENTLVIVATRTPEGILNELKSKGFPYVTTKQEIDKVLFEVPPVKWMSSMEGLENIDYTSKEIQYLISRFNQTIFEVCKHYEDRLNRD